MYSCLSIYLIINDKFLVDKDKKIELSLMYNLRAKDWCQLFLFPLSETSERARNLLMHIECLMLELRVLLLGTDRIAG